MAFHPDSQNTALRQTTLDVDLMMMMAAAGAGVIGHWLEGATLLFLFSVGNSLENYAFGRTRRSIRALMELRPDEAKHMRSRSTRWSPETSYAFSRASVSPSTAKSWTAGPT